MHHVNNDERELWKKQEEGRQKRLFFKLTEGEPDTFRWICTNPKDIPPDDIDEENLNRCRTSALGR